MDRSNLTFKYHSAAVGLQEHLGRLLLQENYRLAYCSTKTA
ncbi:MAG: hypothetical protein EZS28_041402, partial [Streblomastix strix]